LENAAETPRFFHLIDDGRMCDRKIQHDESPSGTSWRRAALPDR